MRWIGFAVALIAIGQSGCTPGSAAVTAGVDFVPVRESSPTFAQVVEALGSDTTIETPPPVTSELLAGPRERPMAYGTSAEGLLASVAATGIEPDPGHAFAANCAADREVDRRRCELLYLDESAALHVATGATARLQTDGATGAPIVVMELAPSDAQAFADLTRRFVGHRLAIRLDAEILSSPVINDPIPGGTVWITPGAAGPAYARRIFGTLTEAKQGE